MYAGMWWNRALCWLMFNLIVFIWLLLSATLFGPIFVSMQLVRYMKVPKIYVHIITILVFKWFWWWMRSKKEEEVGIDASNICQIWHFLGVIREYTATRNVYIQYRVVVTIIMNNQRERGKTTCNVYESRGKMPVKNNVQHWTAIREWMR